MIVSLGGTVGGIIFPLLNNFLIESIGWRSAFRVLAAGLWIIYIPVAFLFLISRPEDTGLQPDGEVSVSGSTGDTPEIIREESLSQGQAIRNSAFWIVTLCVFQSSTVGTGIVLHFVSIFREAEFSMSFAAQIMSIKPIVGFGTALAMGMILDRVKQPKYVLAAACNGQTVTVLMLAFMRGVGMAYAYSVIGGASATIAFYSIGILTPRLFGRQFIGGILGAITAINVVGSAIGPLIYGTVYDVIGNYKAVLLVSALLPFLSGISSLFIRKPAEVKQK